MDQIGDRVVVASVSGGKDSTAMCLHLKELGIPYRAVFLDTGWENGATYQYLKEYLPDVIGPIEWVTPDIKVKPEVGDLVREYENRMGHPSAMVRLILNRKSFPNRIRRFCTEQLKVFPIRDYLASIEDEPVNAIGIRAAESKARSKLTEWEHNETYDCDIWRPLIRWTEQDVIDIHTRHGVRPNPNYLSGASRVGCWPCIYARKSEIRHIADTDPNRISLLEDLEKEISKQSYKNEGSERAWFVDRLPKKRSDGITSKPWPIRKVVEWSRTKDNNGRQFELFTAPERERGCMRWGLCDTGIE